MNRNRLSFYRGSHWLFYNGIVIRGVKKSSRLIGFIVFGDKFYFIFSLHSDYFLWKVKVLYSKKIERENYYLSRAQCMQEGFFCVFSVFTSNPSRFPMKVVINLPCWKCPALYRRPLRVSQGTSSADNKRTTLMVLMIGCDAHKTKRKSCRLPVVNRASFKTWMGVFYETKVLLWEV